MIGSKIREYRRARDMTQSELAEQVGVDWTTVSRWERGVSDVGSKKLAALCCALGVTASDLIGDIEK